MASDREGLVIWLTGLPGAGKTTLGQALAKHFRHSRQDAVELLDGDELRQRFPATGFDHDGRHQHILRAARLSAEYERGGKLVIVCMISPYSASRAGARAHCSRFVEVFVDAPLEECERRDPKGLYRRARLGEIQQFTGISDPYEPPQSPEVLLKTAEMTVGECVARVVDYIQRIAGNVNK
jgi:adenylylsulfate kinase